jgi:hypothetical protein
LEEPHNEHVLHMLFSLAHYHGLAKLRMHSNESLAILRSWTQTLGADVRHFETQTCQRLGTVELDKEYAARQRRKAKKQAAANSKKDKGVVEGPGSHHQGPSQAGTSQQASSGPLTIRIPPRSTTMSAAARGKWKKGPPPSNPPKTKRTKTKASGEANQDSEPLAGEPGKITFSKIHAY